MNPPHLFDIENPLNLIAPSQDNLLSWMQLVLNHLDIDRANISCYICDSEEIQSINQEYRQQDKPTNILSFPFEVPPGLPAEAEENYFLGDLIICPEVIEAEAIEQKKERLNHWAHITIHGILHLLGYDHIKDSEAEEMEALEIQLLEKLNIKNPYHLN
ncbi:rRNA maturation RNase YbeY [Francisellaceae bacterium]|nr:rRNA maturation RNase YbeY [Francisellaceae bacterium]